MRPATNPQQGRGKKQKTICPECGERYLQTVYIQENKKFVRIGLFCKNENCKYFVAD